MVVRGVSRTSGIPIPSGKYLLGNTSGIPLSSVASLQGPEPGVGAGPKNRSKSFSPKQNKTKRGHNVRHLRMTEPLRFVLFCFVGSRVFFSKRYTSFGIRSHKFQEVQVYLYLIPETMLKPGIVVGKPPGDCRSRTPSSELLCCIGIHYARGLRKSVRQAYQIVFFHLLGAPQKIHQKSADQCRPGNRLFRLKIKGLATSRRHERLRLEELCILR